MCSFQVIGSAPMTNIANVNTHILNIASNLLQRPMEGQGESL